MIAGISGFICGVADSAVLFRFFSASTSYAVIKSALGASFFLFWTIAVVAVYRSGERSTTVSSRARWFDSSFSAGVISAFIAIVSGAICACRIPVVDSGALTYAVPVLAAISLAYASLCIEKRISVSFKAAPLGAFAAVVALLLFSSSSLPRLDLFSPLSMKVMKGVHDFVHQFMESILIPDHLFVKPIVWKYIGLLFGKEVGFWGGIIIWFTPVLLIALAIGSARLPSVAHIRQGAQRRKLLAAAIREQRLQLVIP
ncbi:MAG: DUF2318 domain-containing protein, partial [Desulfuromonadaceae bacterium]|nr:DUF2318 domain-containing protein [Desulfuromonadaceae bacterium]